MSDTPRGGETVFPNVPALDGSDAGRSACARKGRSVTPRRGDALLFWSLKPTGELDRGSLHGGCPVLEGTKWVVTKWYHVADYGSGQRVEHRVRAGGGGGK